MSTQAQYLWKAFLWTVVLTVEHFSVPAAFIGIYLVISARLTVLTFLVFTLSHQYCMTRLARKCISESLSGPEYGPGEVITVAVGQLPEFYILHLLSLVC